MMSRDYTKKPKEIFGLAQVAQAEGISDNLAQRRYERKKYPDPDYIVAGSRRRPYWTRETLEKHGIKPKIPN